MKINVLPGLWAIVFLLLGQYLCCRAVPLREDNILQEGSLEAMSPPHRDSLSAMFWNLENFFDWRNDSTSVSDADFSSRGSRRWTRKRFETKCQAIAKTILWASGETGRLPDVIGFAERSFGQIFAFVASGCGGIGDLVRDIGDTTEVEIYSEDIPGWVVANEGTLTVALDIQLTDDLKREGIARELKKRIQDSRKQNGLEITDRIKVRLNSNADTDAAVREYEEWIKSQVLADSIELVAGMEQGEDISFDDYSFKLQIEKI